MPFSNLRSVVNVYIDDKMAANSASAYTRRCDLCNYSTNRLGNYIRHTKSDAHLNHVHFHANEDLQAPLAMSKVHFLMGLWQNLKILTKLNVLNHQCIKLDSFRDGFITFDAVHQKECLIKCPLDVIVADYNVLSFWCICNQILSAMSCKVKYHHLKYKSTYKIIM